MGSQDLLAVGVPPGTLVAVCEAHCRWSARYKENIKFQPTIFIVLSVGNAGDIETPFCRRVNLVRSLL